MIRRIFDYTRKKSRQENIVAVLFHIEYCRCNKQEPYDTRTLIMKKVLMATGILLTVLVGGVSGAGMETNALISGIQEYSICSWKDSSPFITVQGEEVSFCWERPDLTPPRSIVTASAKDVNFVIDKTKVIPIVKFIFGGSPDIQLLWVTRKNKFETSPSGIQINISPEDMAGIQRKK